MSAYIDSIRRAPTTLTEAEQKLLLKTTGQHRAGFRDHLIFSLALGTALREHKSWLSTSAMSSTTLASHDAV